MKNIIIAENTVHHEAVILPIEEDIVVTYEKGAQQDLFLFVPPESSAKQSITIKFLGDGSSGRILGLLLAKGTDSYQGDIRIEHIGKHTSTNVLIKGILSDSAYTNVRGLLRVEPGAKQTDTYYRSDFLLLSREARAVTIPSLEIIENDLLGGGHAATVSSVDPEQLFYIQSRAIGKEAATQLLVQGFAFAVLDALQDEGQKTEYLEKVERAIAL